MPLALTILGTTGKMGQRLIAAASRDPDLRISPSPSEADIIIDFTHASATAAHLASAIALNKPLVLGTTGHTTEGQQHITRAAASIPILYAPNFSFGIALCLDAVRRFSQALKCPVQIVETHHAEKKDAPSGTALALAQAAGGTPEIRSIREGDVVGEHVVVFTWGQERIELKHAAYSRDAFAEGALLAARFLVSKKPGLYSLQDLFL